VRAPGPSGLLVIDKSKGVTSHEVVSHVRRVMGTRRVGHGGTLDPMATGVLLVGCGAATRLLGYLAKADKEYLATIRLGESTVTDDADGQVVSRAGPGEVLALSDEQVREGILRLTGPILQVPSSVSAIKVGGTRSYARVRAGEQVDLPARPVQVTAFEVIDQRLADERLDLDVRVTCSTGTYVRALARDLGAMLGVGGHLTALRRTRVGPWLDRDAIGVPDLQADPDPVHRLVGLARAAAASFASVVVDEHAAADVRHGRPIALPAGDRQSPAAILDSDGQLLALAVSEGGRARYLAVLSG
jgi:tRNA pseudouridine55 synthase